MSTLTGRYSAPSTRVYKCSRMRARHESVRLVTLDHIGRGMAGTEGRATHVHVVLSQCVRPRVPFGERGGVVDSGSAVSASAARHGVHPLIGVFACIYILMSNCGIRRGTIPEYRGTIARASPCASWQPPPGGCSTPFGGVQVFEECAPSKLKHIRTHLRLGNPKHKGHRIGAQSNTYSVSGSLNRNETRAQPVRALEHVFEPAQRSRI